MFGRNSSFRSPVYCNGASLSPPVPAPTPVKRKVVSIPVQFVRSDDKKATADRDAAAIKIQKAFRGFVVRKNMRTVRKIEAEVDEIELKFRADHGMDRIVREEKERLAINEMLMRLLFRLDSVRGVRDYRRRVIRRVIALQEMVDSISAARSDPETLESAAVEEVGTRETADQVAGELDEELNAAAADAVTEESKTPEAELTESESKIIEREDPMEVSEVSHQDNGKPDVKVEEVETLGDGDQISTGWELLEGKEAGDRLSESRQESFKVEEASIGGSESAARVSEPRSNEGRMTEVMERMVAENEKLKGLVTELCERSAQQCRLMGGLAERVEHLEKIVEKMERRKKKRKDSSCSPAGSLDKKCGRD